MIAINEMVDLSIILEVHIGCPNFEICLISILVGLETLSFRLCQAIFALKPKYIIRVMPGVRKFRGNCNAEIKKINCSFN